MLAAAVRSGEERVLAIERDRADRTLDDVGADLDAAVGEEAGQTLPARERIADGFGDRGLLRDGGQLHLEPGLQRFGQGQASRLARGAPRIGVAAAQVAFDGIEFGDASERLCGDRRVATLGDLVKAAPDMRPADRELDATGFGKRPVAGGSGPCHGRSSRA